MAAGEKKVLQLQGGRADTDVVSSLSRLDETLTVAPPGYVRDAWVFLVGCLLISLVFLEPQMGLVYLPQRLIVGLPFAFLAIRVWSTRVRWATCLREAVNCGEQRTMIFVAGHDEGRGLTVAELDGVAPGDPIHIALPVLTVKRLAFPPPGTPVSVVGALSPRPVVVIAAPTGTLWASRPGVAGPPIPSTDA